MDYCDKLERACVSTVEDDQLMTKDLALSIHGKNLKREHYVDTKGFLDDVEKKLKKAMAI